MATSSSVSTLSASPIWPSRPAARPAPKSMKTAMPLAVEVRKTDPRSDSAAITSTATTSPSPGSTGLSGHQPPLMPVIRSDSV